MTTTHYDPQAIAEAIDNISAGLERLMAGFANLKAQLVPEVDPAELEVNPRDPANKGENGKFTPRGVEVCYRLFDSGLTRYGVAAAMDISFGAATHRFEAWKAAGGLERDKLSLD